MHWRTVLVADKVPHLKINADWLVMLTTLQTYIGSQGLSGRKTVFIHNSVTHDAHTVKSCKLLLRHMLTAGKASPKEGRNALIKSLACFLQAR